ncbi:hypothetical protein FF38_03483 [Lucilia cuprina]|uniref:HMG box domain-containing protein n=1 Tax=Lucilia cuprina TaxID=7375 RepID=A0A0L0CHN1_LUCCU|nr:hypothetical protein FF38_03483 [Lucilia cuprina]
MDAVRGSIQSFHEKMDSMFSIINNHPGHSNAAVLTALITGLDGQIDNLAGNIFPIIDKLTLGITSPVTDFLLGPVFQSATDGVQVLVSNILGGSVDFVEDSVANMFTGSINKLENIGSKMKVSEKNMKLLQDTKKQWTNMQETMNAKKNNKAQESESSNFAKRGDPMDAEVRKDVRAENPDAKFGDIGKLIGEKWRSLDEKDKKKYDDLASNDKTRYDQEKEKYNKEKSETRSD